MTEFMDMITAWTAMFFNNLTIGMIGNVFALSMVLFVWIGLCRMSKNPENKFSLVDLFINHKTGFVDDSRFRTNVAFFLTSWAVIYGVLHGIDISMLLGVYGGLWIADRYNSRKASIEGGANKSVEEK